MVDAYSPILRSGRNEQQVIQWFGGFSHFEELDRALELHPILAVFEADDLALLPVFQDGGDRVYIDLPAYLGEKSTRFTDTVNRTIGTFGDRESFFEEFADRIPFPMISGFPDSPIGYEHHVAIHRALEDVYPRIAHRLMVTSRSDGFSGRQRQQLQRLREVARPGDDVFMFDVVDIKMGADPPVEAELAHLSEVFANFETGVLNAFDALQGQPENLTPGLADRFDCSTFGDFAIDRRYPSRGGGRPSSITLTHYHPNHRRVEYFGGEHYADAAATMLEWEAWETEHCDFCADIAAMVEQGIDQDLGRGKRNRMGHYIESVLRGAI